MTPSRVAGFAVVAFNAVALGCLVALHVLSPEFDPSWRLISEYARGTQGGLLSALFLFWGLGTWALVWGLRGQSRSAGFKVGLVLLVVSGLGEVLTAVFDLRHPLHDGAGYLGILTLPVATLLVHRGLSGPGSSSPRASILGVAFLPLASLVVFVATFVVLMATYTSSGATIDPTVLDAKLPEGVIALVGWANRGLVLAFLAWASLLAWRALVKKPRPEGERE